MKGLLIAGTSSGTGKTTLSLALMAAFTRRGLKVQAFKVGPDFIDPGHHSAITGRPSHNLDGWMLSPEENRTIFSRNTTDADIALVEGVMGLFDGFHPQKETGSSAEMAKLLGLPVLLCAGARSLARSFAALIKGFTEFDPGLSFAGVAASQTGPPSHVEILAAAAELVPEVRFLGGLPWDEALALHERHLGLITAGEGDYGPEGAGRVADWVEEALDIEALLAELPEIDLPTATDKGSLPEPQVQVGIARDEAFCFYYEENLRRLRDAGAELVFFSPLNDKSPPPGLDGLYMGGGYPELFARDLAENQGMRDEIAALGKAGLPIYAECGGMMYLGESLEDLKANLWPMTGLLPLRFRMLPNLRSMGYREVRFTAQTPLGGLGATARGHEYHYSEMEPSGGPLPSIYQAWGSRGPAPHAEGFVRHRTVASYVHLHFGSDPALAENFVSCCRRRAGI